MAGQIVKRGGNGLRTAWPSPFSLRRELEDVFNRVWGPDAEWATDTWGAGAMTAVMDLSETEDGYRATLDMPGVETEDIDIQVNGNVLTVTGERKEEKEEKGRTFHRTERSVGSFARSITLPCEIMEDNVAAKLDGGVLTIDLPKAEENKPRKIKVK